MPTALPPLATFCIFSRRVLANCIEPQKGHPIAPKREFWRLRLSVTKTQTFPHTIRPASILRTPCQARRECLAHELGLQIQRHAKRRGPWGGRGAGCSTSMTFAGPMCPVFGGLCVFDLLSHVGVSEQPQPFPTGDRRDNQALVACKTVLSLAHGP